MLSSSPLFSRYIRWVYRKTLDDFKRADMAPAFTKKDCTALLCGTAGEKTSKLFLEHIRALNERARIIILDIGEAQVESSRMLIESKYPDADVLYSVADARHSGLPDSSVDFIDTDFISVYLSTVGLDELFLEWKRILKPGGHIAFRSFGCVSRLSFFTHALINIFCRTFLKSDAYSHSLASIERLLQKHGFQYVIAGKALCSFGYRFISYHG